MPVFFKLFKKFVKDGTFFFFFKVRSVVTDVFWYFFFVFFFYFIFDLVFVAAYGCSLASAYSLVALHNLLVSVASCVAE